MLLLTCRVVHQLTPPYISNLSPGLAALPIAVPATEHALPVFALIQKNFTDRAFKLSAPILWNNLSANLRTCPTIELFKSKLKIHLFIIAFTE